MNEKEPVSGYPSAALFDLDGVVFDTETQYSEFWGGVGRTYHPEVADFAHVIKGQTLVQIYDRWFAGQADVQAVVTEQLNAFERDMRFDYIPGVEAFVRRLREAGVHTAVVTSSNAAKMSRVHAAHPELRGALFEEILTSERFARSKPAPDCYLLGASVFGAAPADCLVFEDSFHGLRAGRDAGMAVVGLATTNPAEAIRPYCDRVIDDFRGQDPEKMWQCLVGILKKKA